MTHDKAIYLLRNASWLGSNETREQTEIAVQMAVKALEIFKQSEWIPCSERLPDMHDEVLVTARGEVSIAWLYVDGKWRSNDMPQPMFRDIIAWMPLPSPYQPEEESE